MLLNISNFLKLKESCFYKEICNCTASNNSQSFMFICGTRPYDWSTQWDLNSIMKVYKLSLLTINPPEASVGALPVERRKLKNKHTINTQYFKTAWKLLIVKRVKECQKTEKMVWPNDNYIETSFIRRVIPSLAWLYRITIELEPFHWGHEDDDQITSNQ